MQSPSAKSPADQMCVHIQYGDFSERLFEIAGQFLMVHVRHLSKSGSLQRRPTHGLHSDASHWRIVAGSSLNISEPGTIQSAPAW